MATGRAESSRERRGGGRVARRQPSQPPITAHSSTVIATTGLTGTLPDLYEGEPSLAQLSHIVGQKSPECKNQPQHAVAAGGAQRRPRPGVAQAPELPPPANAPGMAASADIGRPLPVGPTAGLQAHACRLPS